MAAATLAALGGRRGTRTDAVTGEEPGKILHEERGLAPDWMLAAGYPVRPDRSSRWYWSVDATPLFLVLAAMAGAGGPAVAEAIGWLERALEPTGLLTYAGHAGLDGGSGVGPGGRLGRPPPGMLCAPGGPASRTSSTGVSNGWR